jgi:hypothetical protein
VRTLASALSHFNALATVRVAGPWGKHLVQKFRPDLGRKFAGASGDAEAVLSGCDEFLNPGNNWC